MKITRQEPSQRLAVALMREIEREVVRRKWPVGDFLGSEPDLIARYGVSRAVFREAVRLLEANRVARMRSGPGGGLTVLEPDANAVIHSAEIYLGFRGVSAEALFDARTMVELTAVAKATEYIDEGGIEYLRAVLEQEAAVLATSTDDPEPDVFEGFHSAVAELAGNPAVHLFSEILSGLATAQGSARNATAGVRSYFCLAHDHHREIAEAIIEGDDARAVHRMRIHLQWIADGSPVN